MKREGDRARRRRWRQKRQIGSRKDERSSLSFPLFLFPFGRNDARSLPLPGPARHSPLTFLPLLFSAATTASESRARRDSKRHLPRGKGGKDFVIEQSIPQEEEKYSTGTVVFFCIGNLLPEGENGNFLSID